MMKKLLQKIFGTKRKPLKDKFLSVERDGLTIPERFSKWIDKIESGNLPNDNIKAFNFGLFESNDSYKMYLIGTEKFNVKNDDWACDVAYEPRYKYLDLYSSELNGSEWDFILDYSVSLIKDFIAYETKKNSFLTKAEYITTGFDDGDLIRLN